MTFDPTPFIGRFTQEARELIQQLNEYLIVLEKSPDDQNATRQLMRAAHTLKGSSKILRFHAINRLAHKMEDVLSNIYEGRVSITAQLVDLLFLCTDRLTQCVEAIINQGTLESVEIASLESRLEQAACGGDPAQSEARALSPSAFSSPKTERSETNFQEQALGRHANTIRIDIYRLDTTIRLVSEVAASHKKSEHTLRVLKDLQQLAQKHMKQLQPLVQQPHPALSERQRALVLREIHHLSTSLERLYTKQRDEIASLDLTISELYEEVLQMRMLPLSTVFQSFPRAVRDMAHAFHKQIDFQMSGADTSLDKKIIEKLGTPLTHVLRNCIDHGIESPDERQKQGKPVTGRITLEAHRQSGHIEIRITDDGRGIQTDVLRQRLVNRGMYSPEQAQQIPDTEILNTVFLPGISTSEIITDISGRGFGMDIVKTEIEHLKGSVTLTSQPGQGTQCLFILPVTLTTSRCLLIMAQGCQFAVPIDTIEETFHISRHECIQVAGHEAVRLRNHLLSVVPLADVLGLPHFCQQPSETFFVLVAHSAGKRVGLIVDEIIDEQDVVIKQLPIHLRTLKTVAGATISGENTVILILHIPEVVKLAGHTISRHNKAAETKQAGKQTTILLVEDSSNTAEIEKLLLESQGYAVDVASDGLSALECVEKTPYDLIITDIEMPGLDGFRLTERIRSIPKYMHIPIIMVTSLERETDTKRGLQVGADAYITKGDFEQSRLLETVKSLLA